MYTNIGFDHSAVFNIASMVTLCFSIYPYTLTTLLAYPFLSTYLIAPLCPKTLLGIMIIIIL